MIVYVIVRDNPIDLYYNEAEAKEALEKYKEKYGENNCRIEMEMIEGGDI